jgi:GTPase SAR1 family protein
MSRFDKEVKLILDEIGGMYRRYSDDIIIVYPSSVRSDIKDDIQNQITTEKLEIEERKTNKYFFELKGTTIRCLHEGKGTNKVLEYLGFSFDGEKILLKNASVCKFYYKMHRAIRRGILYSCRVSSENATFGVLFKRRLIRRYTYAGSKQNRICKRNSKTKEFYFLQGVHTYGNYLKYVKKSARLMDNEGIKKQLGKCSNKLSRQMKMAEKKISSVCAAKMK